MVSYPEAGSPTRVESKHKASQHYAGEVLPFPKSLEEADRNRMMNEANIHLMSEHSPEDYKALPSAKILKGPGYTE